MIRAPLISSPPMISVNQCAPEASRPATITTMMITDARLMNKLTPFLDQDPAFQRRRRHETACQHRVGRRIGCFQLAFYQDRPVIYNINFEQYIHHDRNHIENSEKNDACVDFEQTSSPDTLDQSDHGEYNRSKKRKETKPFRNGIPDLMSPERIADKRIYRGKAHT